LLYGHEGISTQLFIGVVFVALEELMTSGHCPIKSQDSLMVVPQEYEQRQPM